MDSKQIHCPHCGKEISENIGEVLSHQLEEELRKEYDDRLVKVRQEERSELEELRKEYDDRLVKVRQEERSEIEKSLKKKIEEDQADQIKSLQDELNEKSRQVQDLNKAKANVERLKREKEELREEIQLETERKLTEQLREQTQQIRASEQSKVEFRLSEKEKIIKQLQEQIQEAQRKAEQGSQQLQGAVQQSAIETWLKEQFPLDTIEEIKPGRKGADCLQRVNTPTRRNVGLIYYESERTKSFQPKWIEKFQADIREKNADIGVLVTESMPKGKDRLDLMGGVWVCSFDEFKGLCTVLRDSIIKLSDAKGSQEQRGDKKNMVYDFVTSNEFRMQVEAIVTGFTNMQRDLAQEKQSIEGLWKRREKQIEAILRNTSYMYNSIKGIAGDTVPTVKLLELPSDEDAD